MQLAGLGGIGSGTLITLQQSGLALGVATLGTLYLVLQLHSYPHAFATVEYVQMGIVALLAAGAAALPRFTEVAGVAAEGALRRRPGWLRLVVLFQDVPLGGLVGGVGEHALLVQLRELAQLRYPRRLVTGGRRRSRSRGRGRWRGRWRGRGRGRCRGGWLGGRRVHPDLAPEPFHLCHVPGLGEPACAE